MRHLEKRRFFEKKRRTDTPRRRGQTFKTHAPAGAGVHRPVQHRLGGAGGVQAGIQRQHVLPGAVEEGHFPPPMGAGEARITRRFQVSADLLRGKPGGGEAVRKVGAKQRGQVGPEQPRHIEAHEGVPAVAVHRQKAFAAPQFDDVQVPAETPVGFAAVGRRLLVQEPLQRKGQSQLHHFTS